MNSLSQTITRYHFLFFLLVAFVLYGNTLGNKYSLDDSYITNNDLSNKGIKGIPKIFKSHYALDENGNNYEYRPLVKTSFAIEYQLFKSNPFVSHFINVFLYALCLFLLYGFLKTFLQNQTEFSLLVAVCVFAALPLHTEVVASLKNRDILLAFIFTLLAIQCLSRFFEQGRVYHVLLSFLCAFLAFLSKLDALPFLLIGPVIFINKYRFKKAKPVILLSLVFLSGFIFFAGLKKMVLLRSIQGRSFNAFENPLYSDSHFAFKIKIMLNTFGFYVKNLVFPHDMACYYGSYTIPTTLISVYVLIALISTGLLLFWFIKNIKARGNLWTGIILFVLPLSMYLNILRPVTGIVGDRLVFFASLGFVVIVCHFIFRNSMKPESWKSLKAPIRYGLIIFFITAFFMVFTRNKDWKNKFTLYESDVKKWPSSVKLNVLYANEVVSLVNARSTEVFPSAKYRDYIGSAKEHLVKAYSLDSSYYNIPNSLAYIEMTYFNRPDVAISWLYKASRHDSVNYEIPLNLCLCYARENNLDSMEKYFSRAVKLKPDDFKKLAGFMKEKYVSEHQERRGEVFLGKRSWLR